MTQASSPVLSASELLEALFGEGEVPLGAAGLSTELSVRLVAERVGEQPEMSEGERLALLAAHLDGGLDEPEGARITALLAHDPAELQDAISAAAFLDAIAADRGAVPSDLPDSPPAVVVPLPRRGTAPLSDSFLLLAAASNTSDGAILCHSQSGLWTIEVFVGQSEEDRAAERGTLLLTVEPDHRATYEGRLARVFVRRDGEERILAEATVCDGEVYAEISLCGLDLRSRDAVSVVFGPAPATG